MINSRAWQYRADLVYLRYYFNDEDLRELAATIDFFPVSSEKKSSTATHDKEPSIEHSESIPVTRFDPPPRSPRYYRVTPRKRSDSKQEQQAAQSMDHTLMAASIDVLTEKYCGDRPPKIPPLVPWPLLTHFMKICLGGSRCSNQVDIPALLRRQTKGQPLKTLPRCQRVSWHGSAHILLDYNHRCQTFFSDYHGLCRQLLNIKGDTQLQIFRMREGPLGDYRAWRNRHAREHPYQLPDAQTRVLILSDLGYYQAIDHQALHQRDEQRDWLRLGRRFQCAGIKPVVLLPCPPRFWSARLRKYFHHVCWDRGQSFPSRLECGNTERTVSDVGELSRGAEQLLIQLAPSMTIEPHLLRAVRQNLSARVADVGSEACAWLHDSTHHNDPRGCYYKQELLDHYRYQFKTQLSVTQKHDIARLLILHHGHQSLVKLFLELTALIDLGVPCELFKSLTGDLASYWQALQQQMASGEKQQYPTYLMVRAWNQHSSLWQSSQFAVLRDMTAKAFAEFKHPPGRQMYPPGLLDAIRQALPPSIEPLHFNVLQIGDELYLTGQHFEHPHRYHQPGLVLAQLTAKQSIVSVKRLGERDSSISANIDIPVTADQERGGQPKANTDSAFRVDRKDCKKISDSSGSSIEVSTDLDTITLNLIPKPDWADGIWQDATGLTLTAHDHTGANLLLPLQQNLTYGQDHSGLFLDFTVDDVMQRMRWIPAGRFMMGSPETEEGRFKNEKKHEVEISQGYWLAETVCTQALWKAVMEEKADDLTTANLPVVSVSWDEVQVFITKLNNKVPELGIRLPTEAEWEYACRAANETAYAFGDDITPEQANIDNYNTVAVKSYPANAWGLYEMHGNVNEWCHDWYRSDYESDETQDPQGPVAGEHRVVRGGAYFGRAEWLRSAYRFVHSPVNRNDYLGFRLARGQQQQLAEPPEKGGSVTGPPQRSEG